MVSGRLLVQLLGLARLAGAAPFSDVAVSAGVAGHRQDQKSQNYLFFDDDDYVLPGTSKIVDSGHGGAWADFNGDGFPDLYATGNSQNSHRLYLNHRDGTFEDFSGVLCCYLDRPWNAHSAVWTGRATATRAARPPALTRSLAPFLTAIPPTFRLSARF